MALFPVVLSHDRTGKNIVLKLKTISMLTGEGARSHAAMTHGKPPKDLEVGLSRLGPAFERFESGSWPLASRKEDLRFMAEGLRAAYAYSLGITIDEIKCKTPAEAMLRCIVDHDTPSEIRIDEENLMRASLRWKYRASKLVARFTSTRTASPEPQAVVGIIAHCTNHKFVAEIEEAMTPSLGDFAPHTAQLFAGTLQEYLLRLIVANDEATQAIGHMLDSLQQIILLHRHGRFPRTYIALSAD